MADTLNKIWLVLLIIIGIMFMLTFFFGVNIKEIFDNTKESIEEATYNPKNDENIIFVDDAPLKIESPNIAYLRYSGISHTIYFEGDGEYSNFLVINFTDTSGYHNKKCYRILRHTITGSDVIFNECSEKLSGEFRCDVQEVDNSGILMGSLYATPVNGGPRFFIAQDDDLYKIILEYFGL